MAELPNAALAAAVSEVGVVAALVALVHSHSKEQLQLGNEWRFRNLARLKREKMRSHWRMIALLPRCLQAISHFPQR